MELEAQQARDAPAVPPYEEWPSVPTGPLKSPRDAESVSAMDVDETENSDGREIRHTSELSMDDIEAAQALEGLRSGVQDQ